MIRINLLGDALAQSAGKKPEGGEPVQVYAEAEGASRASLPIAGALVFLVMASGGGVYYLFLNNEVNRALAEKERLEQEKKKLEPYIKQEAQFRKQKEVLKKKEDAIAGLKVAQSLPVHFLEEVANCLPEDVNLTDIVMTGDRRVTIKGTGRTLEVIQLFRQNLMARTRWFKDVVVPIGEGEGKMKFTAQMTLQNNPS